MINVALIIPCLNEQETIQKVIKDFRKYIKDLKIVIVDNGSTDKTREYAEKLGTQILVEPIKGKGNAIRRAFALVEAKTYVLVDGDDTYDASIAKKMVNMLNDNKLDMVVGVRRHDDPNSFRAFHLSGNKIFNKLFRIFFGKKFSDIFSGYRVLSRRFVKSFPAISNGFEIETELCVHSINLKLSTAELACNYKQRPSGSTSKLKTIADGLKILKMMIKLLRNNKPMLFYSGLSALFFAAASILGLPVLGTYFSTGLVPKFPSLIVSVGLLIISMVFIMAGVILQTIVEFQAENRHLAYLAADV